MAAASKAAGCNTGHFALLQLRRGALLQQMLSITAWQGWPMKSADLLLLSDW